jgi:hypothetical protein
MGPSRPRSPVFGVPGSSQWLPLQGQRVLARGFLVGLLGLWACRSGPSTPPEPPPSSGEASPVVANSAVPVAESPLPTVGLDGSTPEVLSAVESGSRIYAKSMQTWVYAEPRLNAAKLGYLRLGSGVPINPKSVSTSGCPKGWFSLLSHGFVCLDSSSTLDGGDPLVQATNGLGPTLNRKLPYIYGTVRKPGPVYRRLPSSADLAAAEPDLARRMETWLSTAGESGAGFAQQVWVPTGAPVQDPTDAWHNKFTEQLPDFLKAGRFAPQTTNDGAKVGDSATLGTMARRVGYSLLKTVWSEGRHYGLTSKFELVPTDRLRPIQGSDFHGYRIPQDIDFPFVIVRQPGATLFNYDSSSKKLTPNGRAPYRGALKLTGKQNFFHGKLYYETADGLWIGDRDGSRLDPVRKMPAWGSAGEKWIDINVTKQTLALYEGTKAVYATLVSTGEAGLSDPDKSTATKRGIYRIHTKHISATMDSDVVGEEFELRDVPYVQYFESNYALHGAYWHDRFGIPKSHGCINISPEDARRLFFWTEPAVPAGWHGALLPLKGTVMFVHP